MIKTETLLELKISERFHRYYVPSDAPIGEVFDALSQMTGLVVQKINDSQPKKVEEPKIEEIPQE